MCNCRSYNMQIGQVPEIVVPSPGFINSDNKKVCIDACIFDVIIALWNKGIITHGCCCGHNKRNPSVVVSQDYKKNELKLISDIIRLYDSERREWDILQWRLTKVNDAALTADFQLPTGDLNS